MPFSSSFEPGAPLRYGKFFWKPNAGATYLLVKKHWQIHAQPTRILDHKRANMAHDIATKSE
jgi:hypothetical protein